jgi:uncharacterized protein YgiM (DUF1202 family)
MEGDYVVVRRVNLREAPSKGGRVIRMLEAGTKVAVTGRRPDGGWYRVDLDGAAPGWVAANYLESAEEAAKRRAEDEEEAQRRAEAREREKAEEARRVSEAERAFARAQQDIAQRKRTQPEARSAKPVAKPQAEERPAAPEKKGFFRQVFDDFKGSFDASKNGSPGH